MKKLSIMILMLGSLTTACGDHQSVSSVKESPVAAVETKTPTTTLMTLDEAMQDTVEVSVNDANGDVRMVRIPTKKAGETAEEYTRNVFYTLQLDMQYIIIPTDVTAGIGYQTDNKKFEIEAFVGLRALRMIAGDGVNIPYGARVRIAPFGTTESGKRWFVEYEMKQILAMGGAEDGIYDHDGQVSLGVETADGYLFKLGAGRGTHNAWANETHEPEKGNYVIFSVGRKF